MKLKPYPDDPRFSVSRDGAVVNTQTGRIRKPSVGGSRYHLIVASTPNGHVGHYVHHMVAKTWIGPRPPGMHVSHINGDCTDNRCANLRYETPKDNMRRKAGHGTQTTGESHGTAKLTVQDVVEIRQSPLSAKNLAAAYGVSTSQIYRVLSRENWR